MNRTPVDATPNANAHFPADDPSSVTSRPHVGHHLPRPVDQVGRPADLRVQLPGSRFLGYAEYGHPDGRPLLFFHGTYGSRRMGRVLDATAAELGIHVIAPERPGYGLSTYQPHRSLASWAADVSVLADALGIERFAVFGVSGGGPHALACAYYVPDRVRAVGVAGGNAPPDLPGARVGAPRSQRFAVSFFLRAPALFSAYFSLLARLVGTSPQRIVASFEMGLPPSDRTVLEQTPVLRRAMVEDYVETARQAGRGQVSDWAIIFCPWGFKLGDIRVPVHFWQGEQDRSVPVAAARAQAAAIPGSRLTVYPGEAHLAFFTHRAEILQDLTKEA